MDSKAVRLIQTKLQDMGHYTGRIDGDRGPKTHAAARKGLPELPGEAPNGWQTWSDKRICIAFLQLYCHANGINAGRIDGWWGPQTAYGAGALAEKLAEGEVRLWRDEAPSDDNPNGFPTQSGVTAFYGPPGAENFGHPRPPMTKVPCPWTLKIAWNKNQTRGHFMVHEKVAPSLTRVLARVEAAYSPAQMSELGLDLFGGDYNARRMRGGSRWSMHSWGIAIDFDPERNQLKWGRGRARLAERDAIPFWQAFEAEGWLSLGRARNYDWMHVQAARL